MEFEASAGVRGLWFHQQLDEKSAFYHIPMVLRIRGQFDAACLEQALNAMLQAHAGLRTNFVQRDGLIYQHFQAFCYQPLEMTNLQLFLDQAVSVATVLMKRLSRLPINLEKGKLFHTHLYQLKSDDFFFITVMHHLIADGWSWQLYYNELFDRYRSLIRLQAWQRVPPDYDILSKLIPQALGEKSMKIELFWKNLLTDLPTLNLPQQLPRDDYPRFSGKTVFSSLNKRPNQYYMKLGLTPAMYYLAIFEITLHVFSKQDDFGIAIPTVNRDSAEVKNLIGCFIGIVIFRANIAQSETIGFFLKNLRDKLIDIISHTDQNVTQIIQRLSMNKVRLNNPFFQVMYIYQDWPIYKDWDSGCGFTADLEEIDIGTSVFDLTFEIRNRTDGHSYIKLSHKNIFSDEFIKKFFDVFMLVEKEIESNLENKVNDFLIMLKSTFNEETFAFNKSNDEKIKTKEYPGTIVNTIADIWSEILEKDVIDFDVSFFQIGGSSLLALKFLMKLKSTLGYEVSLRNFFSKDTVSSFAYYLESSGLVANKAIFEKAPENIPFLSSYVQQQLWFLSALKRNNLAYNISGVMSLFGNVNFDYVHATLKDIVTRHEVFRTVVYQENGTCYQRVMKIPDNIVSYEEISESLTLEEIKKYCTKYANTAFSLENENLFRFSFIRQKEKVNYLFISVHHCIFDGWSLDIFLREFKTIYNAYERGEAPSLPYLTYRYVDYAYWQRNNHDILYQSKLNYWGSKLTNISRLTLPLDKPRPRIQSHVGAKATRMLPSDLVQSISTFASKNDVTVAQLLLGAYALLLYSISTEKDIVIGVPYAGRDRPEFEHNIGCFVSNLIIRLQVNPNLTIFDFLLDVRQIFLEALDHSDVPFELILKKVSEDRDPSYSPLMQVAFNFVNTFDFNTKISEHLDASILVLDSGGAKYDLSLMVIDGGCNFHCELEYDTALFFPETASDILSKFQHILVQIFKDIRAPIYLIDWSAFMQRDTRVEVSLERTHLSSLFYQQARQQKNRLALVSGQIQFSYEQLYEQVEKLAFQLDNVLPNHVKFVGLLVEHDWQMIVAIMAILRIGAAYVPLNPDYPMRWIEHVIIESGIEAILQSQSFEMINNVNNFILMEKKLAGNFSLFMYENFQIENCNSIGRVLSQDEVAYILFTSGSTGTPKAIMQNHANMVKHVTNYISQVDIKSTDKILQLAAFSHDAAIMDTFSSLFMGATLYLASPKLKSKVEMHAFIFENKINILHTTPTVFKTYFLSTEKNTYLESVNKVILGGESVSSQVANLFSHCFARGVELINLYGASEYSISFCGHHISPIESVHEYFPIGLPLANVDFLLVDKEGYPNQLYGELVYLDDSVAINQELHKAKFTTGFYTGDIFRLLPSKEYAFVSRKDFQVKIRGQRVNLSHIEWLLKKYSQITDAVVIYREHSPNNGQIGAFIVIIEDMNEIMLLENIQTYLRRELPEYMIPSSIKLLKHLPRNQHGKIDRNKLTTLMIDEHQKTPALNASATELEAKLRDLWKVLLNVSEVSLTSSFFDQGGHSLLLVTLQDSIYRLLGVNLALVDLFIYPSIRALADYISDQKNILKPDENFNSMPDRKAKRSAIIASRIKKKEHVI